MPPPSTPSTDWTCAFEGDFREVFCQTIRDLTLEALQRFPPPKVDGLPIGHELRIAGRFLGGGSSMLDPSALSGAYRRLASARQQTLYRGLALGEPLNRDQWDSLIGRETVNQWAARGLLDPAAGDRLACRFRVIVLGPLRLVIDHPDPTIPLRIHIGQDSLNMVEFLARRVHEVDGAMLDVGTGSGLQLLTSGRMRPSALGVDINPRAVRIARLNVELNGATTCSVEERNAFDPQWRPSPFHLVTWNTPFMFFPDSEVANNVDGHGGHLGIALTLSFVERLVELLDPAGVAYLLSAAPVMFDGQNRLEIELAERAQRCRLDMATFVLQKFWDTDHIQFHHAHNIRSFESVMIRIQHGKGRFQRIPPGPFRRSVDWLRTLLHGRHGGIARPTRRTTG